MNLLDNLDALSSQSGSGFDVAFMLTFTANLRFFEELVLPRLERVGASRIAVLADRRGYESTLESPILAEQCGKKYAFNFNARVKALQHAKILWLHGRMRDLVWIGSHNLTASGYNDQREVSARLDSLDLGHVAALRACHIFVSRLIEGAADVASTWNRVPRPMSAENIEPTVHFLHSLDTPIGDQLRDYLPHGGSLRVVTPFLDADALNAVISGIDARPVILNIPYEGLDVPLDGVVKKVPGLVVGRTGPAERLHAKAYVAATDDEVIAVLGSANCTNAGLMRSVVTNGNVECVVVIPGGQLGDDVTFHPVTTVADVPCTGRRSDEPPPSEGSLHIDAATYAGGILTIEWQASGVAEGVSAQVGDRAVPCTESTIRVELGGEPPDIVSLSAEVGGVPQTVRRWVAFPERLEAFAASRGVHRLRQYVGSDEPRSWSDGIDYVMALLLGALRRAEPEGARRGPQTAERRRSSAETSEALEILTYSRDRELVNASVTQLIIGDERTDLLAALRALLRRMTAPIAVEGDIETDDSALRTVRQQRATRRAVDRVITHVRFLADSRAQIEAADEEPAQIFLATSFAAIALAWRHMLKAVATRADRIRFAEAGLRAVMTLGQSERGRALVSHVDVGGPFVLALSAFAQANLGEDSSDLRGASRALLGRSPKDVVRDWQNSHADLVVILTDTGDVESWAADALTLFGVPSARVQVRQQGKWGLFLQLYEADRAGAPEAAELFREAERNYQTEAVWQRYKTMRGKTRLLTPGQPTCTACFQRLPMAKERAFSIGDPVVCSCGAILIFRS